MSNLIAIEKRGSKLLGFSWRNTVPWRLSCEKFNLTRERGMKQFGISVEAYPEEVKDYFDAGIFSGFIIWVFVWALFQLFTMGVAIATKFQVWYL